MPRVATLCATVAGWGLCIGIATHQERSQPVPASLARTPAAFTDQDVLAHLRIRSLAALENSVGGGTSASRLTHALLRGLGLPDDAAAATDWTQPVVVGLLDPQKYGPPGPSPHASGLGSRPLIVRIPVHDETRFRGALGLPSDSSRAGGGRAFRSPTGLIWVEVRDGAAVVAPDDGLLQPARRALETLAKSSVGDDVRLHVSLGNIFGAYGDRAAQSLRELAALTRIGADDAEGAFAMRSLRRLADFATSADAVDVSMRMAPEGLTLSARMSPHRGGSFDRYVAQQQAGSLWGTELLPAESVLVYTTRLSAAGVRGEIDDALAYLSQAAEAGDQERHRSQRAAALERAMAAPGGQIAYAIWPARGGGVGLGGAYQIAEPRRARGALLALQDTLHAEAGLLASRQLGLPPRATRVHVRPSRLRIEGVPIDLVELEVRWPARRQTERRAFEWLFGRRLLLATASLGDRVVFALGRDARERIAAMVHTSRTGRAPSSIRTAADFGRAAGFHGEERVSMSYLPIGRMTRFLQRLADATVPGTNAEDAALLGLQGDTDGVIVSTTNLSPGGGYEVSTLLPRAVVLDLGAVGGALWRIAFQPVVNPPQVPPLPIPPTQLTPPRPQPEPPPGDGPHAPPGRPVGKPRGPVHPV
jgi:hypothetical protein